MESNLDPKRELLIHASTILTAVEKILAMDDNGAIVNDDALIGSYPFSESLDEVHAKLIDYCFVLETSINQGVA